MYDGESIDNHRNGGNAGGLKTVGNCKKKLQKKNKWQSKADIKKWETEIGEIKESREMRQKIKESWEILQKIKDNEGRSRKIQELY